MNSKNQSEVIENDLKLEHISGFWSKSIVIFSVFVLTLTACEKDDKEDTSITDLNRSEMLSNYADQMIIPNYSILNQNMEDLNHSIEQFVAEPSIDNLIDCRANFTDSYRAWQHCSAYEFGPASQVVLRATLNTFPCDLDQIHSNIESGSYNLESISNIDAIGFPALDYLLYQTEMSEEEIVAFFEENDNASNYLSDISYQMSTLVSGVYSSWISNQGNYKSTFIDNDGTDVGSSLGMLVNEMNFDFEIIKNAKIGIPLGKQTLDMTLPNKVEAFYSGISNELAIENLKSIRNIFTCTDHHDIGYIGLEENLDQVDATYQNDLLSKAIKNQFDRCIDKLESIDLPLSEAVDTQNELVNQAYLEIQKQVVLIKTDLPSALSVMITYQDNDGD